MESLLLQSFIYLAAAIIMVPIAKFLNLGSVLGYLLAGIFIGPVFGFVGSETQNLQHFAEFGVVMMLFLVGLELEPEKLWRLRHRIFGLGGLQVLSTALIIAGICAMLGFSWRLSLAIGLILCLSSTAMVLQTLNEKGLMKTNGGQSSFSVLLFQDIAVIPILALLPLLAVAGMGDSAGMEEMAQHASGSDHASTSGHSDSHSDSHGGGHGGEHGDHHGHGAQSMNLVTDFAPWVRTLIVLGAVGLIIFAGKYLLNPFFHIIAKTGLPELFTISALVLVIGISLLMYMVGLSPALGAFLAGVVLANSEFRHELESTIEPFKGILLGLFFITVGAGINFAVLSDQFTLIISATLGLILLKGVILFVIAYFFNIRTINQWLFSLALAQAGEFGFVLLSFGQQNNVITVDLAQPIALIIALSMLLTPVLFILYDRFIEPRMSHNDEIEADDIDETGEVIMAGAGRFGQIIYRLLNLNHHKLVIVDNHIGQIELLRQFGVKSFYGDPSKPELLHAAGISHAKIFIIAVDDVHRSLDMLHYVKKHFPHVKVMARALDRAHYFRLRQANADYVIRDTFHSALELSREALISLGMSDTLADRQVTLFRAMDEQHLEELMPLWAENPDIKANEDLRNATIKANELLRDSLEHDRTLADDHDTLSRASTSNPTPGM